MGFGQIFLECNPVDVGGVVTRTNTPPITAVEEHVFLVRGDPRSVLIIPGIDLWTHIAGFGPGTIGSSQG